MRFLSLFLSLLFVIFTFSIEAQELTPVKWSFSSAPLGNNEYVLKFRADIDETWNVYSQFTSDDGPVPTSINFEGGDFDPIGKATEEGHKKEGFDKLFETNVIKFIADEPFIISQKIKLKDPSKPVTGYLTYMTCDATRCLPPTDVDFSFSLSAENASNQKTTNNKVSKVTQTTSAIKEEIKKAAKAAPTAVKETQIQEEKTTKASSDNIKIGSIKMNESNVEEDHSASNEILDPVKWKMDIKSIGNDEYELIYTATMEKTWKVYSQHTSDDGPVPTSVNYEEKGTVEMIGEAIESGHKKEGPDPLFDNVNVIKFMDDAPFVITQKIKGTKDQIIKGYLTYMTCNDEGCLPPTDVDFMFSLKDLYAGPPKAAATGSTGQMKLDGNVLDQSIVTIQNSLQSPIGDCGGTDTTEDRSLFMSLLLGFLGGLVALLTPCVFPMIPLTVSFFTKDNARKGWVNGLIYALSIIVIYVAMGLLLTAFFGPEALNRLSTNWIANTLFFLIFIFFAFSFFGYYEITLPSSWTTKTDSMANKGGFIGTFFMAFTLALVSFSCTGPIIGSAIVASASNAVGPAVVMLGFSLGLALPFGLFAAFPSWLKTLPQSGGWMNSVKVVLGFLELALAFKFLSVADMTNNWGILRYEPFMIIWVLVFAAMTLYLFGFIKFPHDSPVKKLSLPRKLFGFTSLALTLYLASGFLYNDTTKSYNALGLMSGLAPPAHYTYFLPKPEVNNDIKSKYPSFTKCANNIDCFKDYYEGISYAKENNKPVFLDFTGHGCVNCRKTEEHIWVMDDIRNSLNEDFVLVSLYVDDDKKLDQVYISKQKKKKMRNVGNKWADFQIVNFKQNSQPLYVMMTPDEQVIANPRGYQEGVSDYKDYMDCGLAAFKARK